MILFMDKEDALKRLNLGKSYEDKLVSDLGEYFIDSLSEIPDITSAQRDKIKLNLSRILDDSRIHSLQFTRMIELVIEHGNDKF
jgi:hypothetical protein